MTRHPHTAPPVRFGVAGTGRIARQVGALIAAVPGCTVSAVGSRDAGRAQALARELGAGVAVAGYAELARHPEVDAVYVATPHPGHAEVAEVALRAGRGVLSEKPLTASLAETERLVGVARETGSFLMEGMWTRFNPLVQQVRQLLRSGVLGEPRALHASFGFAAPDDPTSRLWSPTLGGGALLDLGVYTVDLARNLLGEPVALEVVGSLAATGVDAESTTTLTFGSGARALLDVSLRTRLPGTATLVCSQGVATLGPSFHAPTLLVCTRAGREPEEHRIDDRDAGFVGEVAEVVRCLAEGRAESAVMPWSASVGTARVLQQARDALGVRGG